jgi:adenylate cyclase class IV
VQQPRRNIELKATDPDPSASLAVCRALGAEDRGTIAQRDTYFAVAHGGLKLREEQPGSAAPDPVRARQRTAAARESIPHHRGQRQRGAAHGARRHGRHTRDGRQRRHLLLWQSVRIHLDQVERLGTFIELEAVAPPDSDLTHEYRLVAELRDGLGIADDRLVALGYAEQLLRTDDDPETS